MSVVLQLRRDYIKGLPEFKQAAKAKYPNKKVDQAIQNCKDTVWKRVKGIFAVNPHKPLYADVAEILEKAILSS